MAADLADDNFECIFFNENDRIPIRFSLKFIPRSPIDNKPALIQVMAWRRTGNKPSPEPLLTQFTDAYMRHLYVYFVVHISWNENVILMWCSQLPAPKAETTLDES